MNTTGTIIVVGAVGVAVVLYLRSQQQQSGALGAAQQQQQAAAAAAGGGGGGGGITGFAQGLWTQWKGDPLGIQNTKAAISTVGSVVKTGVQQIASLPSDIIGGIRSIF